MKTIISAFALSLLIANAAVAQTAPKGYNSPVMREVQACKANAGATNGPEKEACIQVAIESAIKVCELAVSSSAMKPERDYCIQVAIEDAASQ